MVDGDGEDLDPVGVGGCVVVGGLPGCVDDDGVLDVVEEEGPPALVWVGGQGAGAGRA